MSETVWINGKFVGRDEARVSAFDAGFQHGVGLFETMLATGAGVHGVDRHMARLRDSAGKRVGFRDERNGAEHIRVQGRALGQRTGTDLGTGVGAAV